MRRKYIAWPVSSPLKLKCQATGAVPLVYKWYKEGRLMLGRRLDPFLNTSLPVLRFKELVPSDDGNYTCVVTNKYGRISHKYTVKTIGKCSCCTSKRCLPSTQFLIQLTSIIWTSVIQTFLLSSHFFLEIFYTHLLNKCTPLE